MTIETLKSPNPRNRNGISVIKSKFLSVSSMNTLLAILKVTDARRDVMLAGGLYHRFPWRHLPSLPWGRVFERPAEYTQQKFTQIPPPPPGGFERLSLCFTHFLNFDKFRAQDLKISQEYQYLLLKEEILSTG